MRNNNLDILKIILAFLVVALHIFPVTKLNGIEGLISYEIASAITRIAVPTFFLISGYFLRNKLEDKFYLWNYVKRILGLYLLWQLIYIPDLLRFYHLGRFSTFDMVLKLVYGYWHLWYLLASVLAVGLLVAFKNISPRLKIVLGFSLLFLGYLYQILIQSDTLHHFMEWQFVYEVIGTTRNFVFFAFPMMLLGTQYDRWSTWVSSRKKIYAFLWLLLLAEGYIYYQYQVKAMDFLLVLPLLSMFTLVICNESKSITDKTFNPTFSLGIYLCHPYAIRLVYEFLPQKTLGFTCLKYVLISGVAIVFWWIVDQLNKRVPYFF